MRKKCRSLGVLSFFKQALVLLLPRLYRRAEWQKRQLHELEGLKPCGNAYDGDAADHACSQIAQRHLPAEKDGPKDVGDGVLVEIDVDLFAEGGEGQLGCLEALLTEGDADDGDAEQDPQDGPGKAQPQAAEDEPDDVCDEFHDVPPEYGGPCIGPLITA